MPFRRVNDFAGFKKILDNSKNIVALTGAGVSAESGIPVFRGAGGIWRTHRSADLASLRGFQRDPSLVWEFYHYRRTVAFGAEPNKAHISLAKFEQDCKAKGLQFQIVTQNVDGLHQRAGSQNVIELHGSLNRVKCLNTKCGIIQQNTDHPICEALRGRGDPAARDEDLPSISIADLPKCKQCNALVRPYIVWFGENLNPEILKKSDDCFETCDLCLVIGTSLMVSPAAQFAPRVAERGYPVVEFNITEEPSLPNFQYHFAEPATVTLPKALGYEDLKYF